MFLTSTHPLALIGIGDAGILALLGYALVFMGLIVLMLVVTLLGKIFISIDKRKVAKAAPAEAPAPVVEEAEPETAPGSAGQLKLYNVEPKTAAMIMAIVADKLGKPLNELRFISIKEVE